MALIDAETVLSRLEEAGRTLFAMPNNSPRLGIRTQHYGFVVDAAAAAASNSKSRLRPAIPDARHISRMDEAMSWISLIPLDRYVLRRIVGARSLVHPITGRHVHSWRKVANSLGYSHQAVRGWHAQGIDLIVAALRRAL
jgi:hypothetical protein